MKSSKYKALICDVNGTLLSHATGPLPSHTVTNAIQNAQKKVHVGLATARPLFLVEQLLSHLTLTGPTIINGGAQIIDSESKQLLFEQTIDSPDIHALCTLLKNSSIQFFLNDNGNDIEYTNSYSPYKPYSIILRGTNHQMETILTRLSQFPTISAHKFIWNNNNDYGISITHIHATKQHAVLETAKILAIHPSEIIGIGDSYNDVPLFMACGLKVAMGNATNELKKIADYIAPSVSDNGVADVIEKFIS